jgi:hypothetical protein
MRRPPECLYERPGVAPFLPSTSHQSRVTSFCRSFVFISLQIPLPATPFFSHPYKTPGASPLPCFPRRLGRLCVSYLCRKPRVRSALPPLFLSLRSFPHRFPLFSSVCSLFCENAGVGGWVRLVFGVRTFRCALASRMGWVYGTCQPFATMLKFTRHLYEHP